MAVNFPEWATEKQKEGMQVFYDLTTSLLPFETVFEISDDVEREHQFVAKVLWTRYELGDREVTFVVDWDYQELFSSDGCRIYVWQCVLEEDFGMSLSQEFFCMYMFQELDKILDLRKRASDRTQYEH